MRWPPPPAPPRPSRVSGAGAAAVESGPASPHLLPRRRAAASAGWRRRHGVAGGGAGWRRRQPGRTRGRRRSSNKATGGRAPPSLLGSAAGGRPLPPHGHRRGGTRVAGDDVGLLAGEARRARAVGEVELARRLFREAGDELGLLRAAGSSLPGGHGRGPLRGPWGRAKLRHDVPDAGSRGAAASSNSLGRDVAPRRLEEFDSWQIEGGGGDVVVGATEEAAAGTSGLCAMAGSCGRRGGGDVAVVVFFSGRASSFSGCMLCSHLLFSGAKTRWLGAGARAPCHVGA
ncbi:unnamed protein product [Urochloa humidicola]